MQEAELYLVGGALLFYLLDSGLFLYGDELLYATGPRGWHNVAGGGVLLFGRRALLPNPLLPAARVMRICWSKVPGANALEGKAIQPAETMESAAFRAALRPLQFGVAALLLFIAGALPAVLYAYGQGMPLLGLLLAIYVLNISMTAWLWRARAVLALDVRSCALLSIDLLLCPPFGINVARKICLRQPSTGDPLAFAEARFGRTQFLALCALLLKRARVELAAEEPGNARHRQLEGLCQRLVALAQ